MGEFLCPERLLTDVLICGRIGLGGEVAVNPIIER
jgi:hypothetical protein